MELNGDLTGRQLFPADNWWNLDISGAPVDPQSSAFIAFIGADDRLHPDFGPPPYGIPYVVVGADQPRVDVTFDPYGAESDTGAPGGAAGYPIPDEARTLAGYIEGAQPGGGADGDRHLLIVDRDRWLLYETWATRYEPGIGWTAGSGAVFDLATNDRRPDGWTSADAAGLAVLPGLVRADEVFGAAEIRHAFRFTVRSTDGYVWPASHRAGSTPGALPMGARLRLKSSVDLSSYGPEVRKIFRAMQRYGLIVTDNGSDMFIQGTMDARWDNDILNPAFRSLRASDFEVIELGWRP
ncbi:MAG: hypothetical protein R3195_03150 [Gemmatimonadota bacterium]|nr:hypothetical protein [Gemmatimonadota bacterium]